MLANMLKKMKVHFLYCSNLFDGITSSFFIWGSLGLGTELTAATESIIAQIANFYNAMTLNIHSLYLKFQLRQLAEEPCQINCFYMATDEDDLR